MDYQTHSTLKCPVCRYEESLEMLTDACLLFHTCHRCGTTLKPAPGDCCVFCSFGDVPCPPVQRARAQASNTGDQ